MDGLFLIFILLLIVAFIAVPIFIHSNKKKEAWTGILEDKKISEYNRRGKRIVDYIQYFRKDTGNSVKYNVPETVFNSLEKGDRVEKKKGENYPVKILL